jgi:hypothetical protein
MRKRRAVPGVFLLVIPAQAGIQWRWRLVVAINFKSASLGVSAPFSVLALDSGLRRNDERVAN